jgi:hypothetical protein
VVHDAYFFKFKYQSMMGINEDNNNYFSSYKLPNATFFLSSMTYLYITFKNLTLYGSRCICFKFEYKSLMGIIEDNKGFFLILKITKYQIVFFKQELSPHHI